MTLSPPPPPSSSYTTLVFPCLWPLSHSKLRSRTSTKKKSLNLWRPLLVSASASASPSPCCSGPRALIFNCDGVILESEHLHRQAYNDAFAYFNVRYSNSPEPLNWGSEC
ncbi:HAD-like domain containing protein [Trema orientale]|uniref:HAD-like domain containing protein n=1 Tax=Trema orientale TaxID=63057 RepID=A0A2P5EZG3_TREOI|nr:HAD-like domain containing protein [Trema orientale]